MRNSKARAKVAVQDNSRLVFSAFAALAVFAALASVLMG